MNQAMTIYSKYFHSNKSANKLGETESMAIRECEDYVIKNGEKVYKFDDNSELIFTRDNVQVTLF